MSQFQCHVTNKALHTGAGNFPLVAWSVCQPPSPPLSLHNEVSILSHHALCGPSPPPSFHIFEANTAVFDWKHILITITLGHLWDSSWWPRVQVSISHLFRCCDAASFAMEISHWWHHVIGAAPYWPSMMHHNESFSYLPLLLAICCIRASPPEHGCIMARGECQFVLISQGTRIQFKLIMYAGIQHYTQKFMLILYFHMQYIMCSCVCMHQNIWRPLLLELIILITDWFSEITWY